MIHNADSCIVDLDNVGDWAGINAIYGIFQSNVININTRKTILRCNVDWMDTQYYEENKTCHDWNHIASNVVNKIQNNEIILQLSDPKSNIISCDDNIDCVMYISQQLNPVNIVSCPNGSVFCAVVWYEYTIYLHCKYILEHILPIL